MSVLGNVIVGSIYGKNEKKISLMNAEKNAIEILDLVKLMSKKNVLASNLTYGDKKRLELAKALATNPELLLLDEVMGGLNPVELSEFMKIIKDINYNGITLVLIEHVMQAIMELGEEIYVLDHGKKIAFGTPAEVSKDRLVIESYIGKVD
jgi:branched-chain amino acid transport system ATP-binding protein